jgi:S1-C subfamily serine protease
MRKYLIPVALLAVIATACTVDLGDRSTGSDTATTRAARPLPSTDEPIAAVVGATLPAVVNVTTDVLSPSGATGQGVGTGFVVRSDGVIVTNCHVVEGGSKITVVTSAEEPQRYDARVIGGDCEHDLAVLKIDATDLPTVELGNSSALQLGQRVVAIGYALALEGGPSVTTGIVSSLDRTVQVQDPNCDVCANGVRTYSDVVQTDAAINHGNSGGPLLNMSGEVIGINSAGSDSAENIGFAIAIDSAKSVIEHAMSNPLEPTGYLGVTTQTMNAAMAVQLGTQTDHGAYVVATTPGGPAAGAGIDSGDVIVSIDDQAVSTSEDLGTILGDLQPGDTVTVVVDRDGDQRSIGVTLGARPLPTQLP